MELLFRACLLATFVRARTGMWLRIPSRQRPGQGSQRKARAYALMAKLDA